MRRRAALNCWTSTIRSTGRIRGISGRRVRGQRCRTQSLRRSVFAYTRDTIKAFRKAGVMPNMVQVGNEVTACMDVAGWTTAGAMAELRGPAAGQYSRLDCVIEKLGPLAKPA